MKKPMFCRTSSPILSCGDIDRHLCMGCGICVGLCPRDALKMDFDKRNGTFIPRTIPGKCSGCGLCRRVCPGLETDLSGMCLQIWGERPENERIGRYKSAYAAYSMNDAIRFKASSGGVVTSLLIQALEQGIITGALVTRMCRDVPWRTEPFIAKTPDEIASAMGSKYCPVPLGSAVKKILNEDGRYAVVGLPCHIYGLRKAQMRLKTLRRKVVITLGLFCAGGRSYKGVESFLLQSGMHLNDVHCIRYRGNGWPGETSVQDTRGRSVSCSYEVSYPFMCMHDVSRCAVCPDKTSELADISFGDVWLQKERPDMGAGKTVCVIRSEAGSSFFGQALKSGAIAANPMDQKLVLATADMGDKKQHASARMLIARWLGRPVPDMPNYAQKDGALKDIGKGLLYYCLQSLCHSSFFCQIYFLLKPKYRVLRQKIGIR